MFDILLLDLDDTILDFHKAEGVAIRRTFRHFGIDPTDAVVERYSVINKAHWARLERKELTREQVLVGRFAQLFAELGVETDATGVARQYEQFLSQGHWFLPGAEEALIELSAKYRLFLVSNGTAIVQKGRLDSSGIRKYFEKIFVSQEIGATKPSLEYFDAVFSQIPNFDKTKAIIVGDSLGSDILGGINAGIATCWVNPHHTPANPHIPADYEIEALAQLPALLAQGNRQLTTDN